MDFKYLQCTCGGIIGSHDKEIFTCAKCGNIYLLYQLIDYDFLITNDKTGCIFPVKCIND